MSKWGDPSNYESPNREAVEGARRELSILLSGAMVFVAGVVLLAALVMGLGNVMEAFAPIVLGVAFFGPPLSVIGFITSRGRTRYITGSLTIASFLVYAGVALVVL